MFAAWGNQISVIPLVLLFVAVGLKIKYTIDELNIVCLSFAGNGMVTVFIWSLFVYFL